MVRIPKQIAEFADLKKGEELRSSQGVEENFGDDFRLMTGVWFVFK